MKVFMKQIFPSSCHILRVWSKYLPHHLILEYLQPVFVRQTGKPSFTPYATSGVITILLSKRHPDNMLFAEKKNMYKNQTAQVAIQYAVCFLYLINKRNDTFL